MSAAKQGDAPAGKLQYGFDVCGRGQLSVLTTRQSLLNLLGQLGHLRDLDTERRERLLNRSPITSGGGGGLTHRDIHPVQYDPYWRPLIADKVSGPQTLLVLPIHRGNQRLQPWPPAASGRPLGSDLPITPEQG